MSTVPATTILSFVLYFEKIMLDREHENFRNTIFNPDCELQQNAAKITYSLQEQTIPFNGINYTRIERKSECCTYDYSHQRAHWGQYGVTIYAVKVCLK